MRWLVFLIILIPSQTFADFEKHITFNHTAVPNTYRAKYTGIRGAIHDLAYSTLRREWRESLQDLYTEDIIPYYKYKKYVRQMNAALHNHSVEYWWTRHWTNSIGPSPPYTVRTFGPQGDFLDLGFARITDKFKFKLKEYKVIIYGKESRQGEIKSSSGLEYKFSPTIDFSSKQLVRRVIVRNFFTFVNVAKKVLRANIFFGYDRRHRFLLGIDLDFLNW